MVDILHNGSMTAITNDNWGVARVLFRDNPWTARPYIRDSSINTVTLPSRSNDGTGVDVYIVDGGVTTTHSEMTSVTQLAVGLNIDGNGEAPGLNDHATAVAGMVGAASLGIAPGVNLFSAKCGDEGGSFLLSRITTALIAVKSHAAGRSNPFVVNISLENSAFNSGNQNAINSLAAAGGCIFASVGNDGELFDTETNAYPAGYDNVFAVGACDISDRVWSFALSQSGNTGSGRTSYGSSVDIYAPGVQIPMCDITSTGGRRVTNGTSFASPLAAGVAACMLQGRTKFSSISEVSAFYQEMRDSATVKRLKYFGFDNLSADRLLYLNPNSF